MLSTRSNPTFDPSASLSYYCDGHRLPFLDAEHSDTDCPTETETETPPDSPTRPVSGSSSNNKRPALNIVQATTALSLIAKEAITRRPTPEISDDSGYIAEGEMDKVLVVGKKAKKAFPPPEGPIWFRRQASSHSRSPSPRGGPSGGSPRASPLASRSASPRELPRARPVGFAGQSSPSPSALVAAVPSAFPSSAIISSSSKSGCSLHTGPGPFDIPLPPRPVIFPEAFLSDDLDAFSPLELPAPIFTVTSEPKLLPLAQPLHPVHTSATTPLPSTCTTTTQPTRMPQPPSNSSSSPLSLSTSIPAPTSETVQLPSRPPLIARQLSAQHSIVPHIKPPPGLVSIGLTSTPRPSPLPSSLIKHPLHPTGVPFLRRRWSTSPPPSPFAQSPLGLGLRRVPLDTIPGAGSLHTARDGNGVVPPGWFVPRPLSPTTAAVVGAQEKRSTDKSSLGVGRGLGRNFNPYFPPAPTSLV